MVLYTAAAVPHAGCGVVRIDTLRFLAGCRKKRLNLPLLVLSQVFEYVIAVDYGHYLLSDWLERLF